MRTGAWLLIFVADVFAFALAVYKFTHKQPLAGVLLTFIGLSALAMSAWSLVSAARLSVPLDPIDSGRIVMRASSQTMGSTLLWAFAFVVGAIALAENPELLWTRWLGYPAALLALALAGIVLVGARGERVKRYIADARGFEEHSDLSDTRPSVESEDGEEYRSSIAWPEVGAVKRIETRTRGSSGRASRPERTLKRELVFFDLKGKQLMSVDDGLDPPERYKLFLESIPRWTGLQVKEERKH